MNVYRFSPIQNEEQLQKAVEYVVERTSALAEKVVGKSFPIRSLTIFSHDGGEFVKLAEILSRWGKPYNENNGPRVVLYEPIEVGINRIIHLRIRKPALERPQVGCGDFDTDYESFKTKYLAIHPQNLRLIQRPEYEMIEFFHPEFDVLAYVVSK